MLGQDLQTSPDGVFRIARRVAKDRVISTVDPEARHGHKTAARDRLLAAAWLASLHVAVECPERGKSNALARPAGLSSPHETGGAPGQGPRPASRSCRDPWRCRREETP